MLCSDNMKRCSSVSSLQSLNEILASGSKEDSKAAVEKQVKWRSEDHQETTYVSPLNWCPHKRCAAPSSRCRR